jgi:copper chaperone CopZ
VQKVEVNLDTKLVTVEHGDKVAPAAIIAAIQEAGYEEVSPVA